MVVNEETESIEILEWALLLSIPVFDVVHRLSGTKDILDGVVEWVVEESSQRALVWSYVSWVTIEALSHLKDT